MFGFFFREKGSKNPLYTICSSNIFTGLVMYTVLDETSNMRHKFLINKTLIQQQNCYTLHVSKWSIMNNGACESCISNLTIFGMNY